MTAGVWRHHHHHVAVAGAGAGWCVDAAPEILLEVGRPPNSCVHDVYLVSTLCLAVKNSSKL